MDAPSGMGTLPTLSGLPSLLDSASVSGINGGRSIGSALLKSSWTRCFRLSFQENRGGVSSRIRPDAINSPCTSRLSEPTAQASATPSRMHPTPGLILPPVTRMNPAASKVTNRTALCRRLRRAANSNVLTRGLYSESGPARHKTAQGDTSRRRMATCGTKTKPGKITFHGWH